MNTLPRNTNTHTEDDWHGRSPQSKAFTIRIPGDEYEKSFELMRNRTGCIRMMFSRMTLRAESIVFRLLNRDRLEGWEIATALIGLGSGADTWEYYLRQLPHEARVDWERLGDVVASGIQWEWVLLREFMSCVGKESHVGAWLTRCYKHKWRCAPRWNSGGMASDTYQTAVRGRGDWWNQVEGDVIQGFEDGPREMLDRDGDEWERGDPMGRD